MEKSRGFKSFNYKTYFCTAHAHLTKNIFFDTDRSFVLI